MSEENKVSPTEWAMKNWKIGMAFVYTVICIFDFIIAPSWVGITRTEFLELIVSIEHLTADVQARALELSRVPYDPITLKGGGLFHLSFGAILTTSAFNKNDPKLQGLNGLTK